MKPYQIPYAVNNFLKYFTINDATVPDVLIDMNVRTDESWIKYLTLGEENLTNY